MPQNGQRLAGRAAAEERHLGHINLQAAGHQHVRRAFYGKIQRGPASGGEGLTTRM
jgi:hypothetical protein